MDLADVGGNVKDGCHIASMGGTWMMLTYGLVVCGTMTARCHSGHARPRTTLSFDFP
jgi:trehalose/maltose hydrolase-like predicted phosphorylase